jgi:hypothetical protein
LQPTILVAEGLSHVSNAAEREQRTAGGKDLQSGNDQWMNAGCGR